LFEASNIRQFCHYSTIRDVQKNKAGYFKRILRLLVVFFALFTDFYKNIFCNCQKTFTFVKGFCGAGFFVGKASKISEIIFTGLLCQNRVRFSFRCPASRLKSALFWHKILHKNFIPLIFSSFLAAKLCFLFFKLLRMNVFKNSVLRVVFQPKFLIKPYRLAISVAVFMSFAVSALGQTQKLRTDSLNGYTLQIPQWLAIKDDTEMMLGGVLPPVKDIENAISVTAFPKSKFRSFDDFKTTYLTGNVFGKPTLFNTDFVWYGQNELQKTEKGVAQKVFIFWNNAIYHDKFVLLETKKAYLFIQFVATDETYDLNIKKFDKFLAGLKMME
jgi:hypothetical protein